MKRIAFFQDNLDVGGIQKSIMNLLRNFDYEGYQVDLYLSDRKSFWHVDFPEQLTIKYLPHIPRIYSFMPFDTAKKLVHLDFSDCEEYDLAIDFNSYQFSCALGALTVPAKRRVMWIHNNVSVKLQNEWKYRVLWSNFKDKFKYYDEFVGVSEGVIRPFKECSGVYDKPFNVIQNVIDTNEIYQKAEEETDFEVDSSKMNFVAIGRLCHQKGYDIMLNDFCEASKYRDDLHLYIIGDGDKRLSLEYMRDSLGLTDKVTFLGQRANPFVYMDKMDAFVSTSRYEGQPLNIMEARAVGLPLYCTKNLEIYSKGLEGREDIVDAIVHAQKEPKHRDDLHEYNTEIINCIKALAEHTDAPEPETQKKRVSIIALHLGMGGVEKAIISMANLFAARYDVYLYSVYKMPGSPSVPLDDRVRLHYLLHDTPNREEWKAAARKFAVVQFIKESFHSVRILIGKKLAVIRTIKGIKDGVLICTRHEDNLKLSKYGNAGVIKIAQLHHDHDFKRKYVRGFRYGYRNIDYLAMLTPKLTEEAQELMRGYNGHTEVVYIPNFLTRFPENVSAAVREKTVLAAGRLTEVKRFDLLIEQFAHIHEREPEWKLRILGDGEDRAKLEEQIAQLGAGDYITLTGRKTGDEVEREMLSASVFAMSSRSEGFPFVLMEAQSCGLPVIAYDVRVGPGAVVHDGEDGVLVPEGERRQFEDKLCELMDSPELREKMSANATAAIREFSEEKVAEKWYEVIE